jgi:hypothetical protein
MTLFQPGKSSDLHAVFTVSKDAVLVEVEPPRSDASEAAHPLLKETVASSALLIFLLSGCIFVFRGAVRLKSLAASSSSLNEGAAHPLAASAQAPCSRCRYFTANAYLMCAVNPSIVLKPEAKDCADFQSRVSSSCSRRS